MDMRTCGVISAAKVGSDDLISTCAQVELSETKVGSDNLHDVLHYIQIRGTQMIVT